MLDRLIGRHALAGLALIVLGVTLVLQAREERTAANELASDDNTGARAPVDEHAGVVDGHQSEAR